VMKDFYTVATSISCIMSLTCNIYFLVFIKLQVRICLCLCLLFIFKDISLRSNFYQYIFFEVPFYFYVIVGYALNFSWVSLYTFLKNVATDRDIEARLA
jgi:hypothetical protein